MPGYFEGSFKVMGRAISALVITPSKPVAALVFAFGAKDGMRGAFMDKLAFCLCERGIGTFRYQLPLAVEEEQQMNSSSFGHEIVRAACFHASQHFDHVPIFAGGKRRGGLITTHVQSILPIEEVRGLVLMSIPLHSKGKASVGTAKHFSNIEQPMLIISGDHDTLARKSMLQKIVWNLEAPAELTLLDGSNHEFEAITSGSWGNEKNFIDVLDIVSGWVNDVVAEDKKINDVKTLSKALPHSMTLQ